MRLAVFLLLPVVVFPLPVQIDRATLTGTVLNPSQDMVSGAKVVATAVARQLEHIAATNGFGFEGWR